MPSRDHCSYQRKIHWGNSMIFVFWSCQVTLRPPPRPLPLLIVERFHFIHFIRSLTHSFFLLSCSFSFHVIFLFVLFLLITASNGILLFPLHDWVRLFFVFLDHTEIYSTYFLIHFRFFVDPPPVNGILLFPLDSFFLIP